MAILKILEVVKKTDVDKLEAVLGWEGAKFHQWIGWLWGAELITRTDVDAVEITGKGDMALYDHKKMEQMMMNSEMSQRDIRLAIENAVSHLAPGSTVEVKAMHASGLFVQGVIYKPFDNPHEFVCATSPDRPDHLIFFERGKAVEAKSA
jgi:hypothetical protein